MSPQPVPRGWRAAGLPCPFQPLLLALVIVCPAWVLLPCRPAPAQEDIAVSCERIYRECPGALIHEIRILSRDIFDASDGLPAWFPWKTVNRLHVNTRESTIRANLLVETGQPLDVERIRETQRKLRSLGYLRDEQISCTETEPGRVRVDVSVRENWTLIPIVDFGGQGTGTAVTLGLTEQNLLGRGKTLAASFRNGAQEGNTVIEQRWSVAYQDPNVLGSEYRLYGNYQHLETGEGVAAYVERPFFSLESLWSGRVQANHFRQRQFLYQDGGMAAQYVQQTDAYGIDLGLAVKRGPPTVHRVRAFYNFERKRVSGFEPFGGEVAAPPDETYSYPGLGYRRLGTHFIREQRIDQFDREEYFNMANDLELWAGFSAEALGAENDQWVFGASDRQGYRFRPGHFFLLQGSAAGFLRSSELHNTRFVFRYDHYLRDTWVDFGWFQNTFHWGASVGYGIRLDPDRVFGLGYTSGLRGYDYYAFTGNKFLRFGVEDRIHIAPKLFGILAFGLLLFGEGGMAWAEGESMDPGELRYDVGCGLRAAVPSAAGKSVVQLTWGFPVGSPYRFLGDMIFTVSVSSSF